MMLEGRISKAWLDILEFPLPGRLAKPRDCGLTMVIDKGVGITETRDILSTAGNYVDIVKLGFGTSALYPKAVLQDKIFTIRSFGVDVCPGGTFFEASVMQGKMEAYINMVWSLGFSAIEISDGTIKITEEVREKAIYLAANTGLKVLTEVGKKHPDDTLAAKAMLRQVERDLAAGAYKVIMEGRESGKGIGFYDAKGNFKNDEFELFLADMNDVKQILWEAPLKNQQQELIVRFGPNVNLGNIAMSDILALETLRVGLRGDTLRNAVKKVMTE